MAVNRREEFQACPPRTGSGRKCCEWLGEGQAFRSRHVSRIVRPAVSTTGRAACRSGGTVARIWGSLEAGAGNETAKPNALVQALSC